MGTMDNIVVGGGVVKSTSRAPTTTLYDLGYFKDGATVAPTAEHYFVEGIEGNPGRHRGKRIKEDWTVSFNLLEPQANDGAAPYRVVQLWADIKTTITGGSVSPWIQKFGGDAVDPRERLIEITGIVPGSGAYTRTWYFYRGRATGMGEHKITDFEESSLPCVFSMMYDSTESAIGRLTDNVS